MWLWVYARILTAMPMTDELSERYKRVMDRVAAACVRSGRTPGQVVTVAVTKTAGMDQVRRLVELGHRDLGENRVQQLQQRVAILEEQLSRRALMGKGESDSRVRWHMIGHLQRNKVRAVLPLVKLIHGVDTMRLAEELQDEAASSGCEVDVLLQVNVSGEASKYGVPAVAAPHVAEQIFTLVNLRLRGLMTMAPQNDNPGDSRPVFQRCRELFEEIRAGGACGPGFNLLSMGMSDDFETAIECGANIVRIGRAIFGEAVLSE